MAYPMGPSPTEAQDEKCVETIHQEGIEDPWNGCPGCRSPSQLWKMVVVVVVVVVCGFSYRLMMLEIHAKN